MKKLFTNHPQNIGETYFEHMGYALCMGTRMFVSGLACIVHGFLPFLFEKTASNSLQALQALMAKRCEKKTMEDKNS